VARGGLLLLLPVKKLADILVASLLSSGPGTDANVVTIFGRLREIADGASNDGFQVGDQFSAIRVESRHLLDGLLNEIAPRGRPRRRP